MATGNGTIHVEIDPTTPLPERYLGSGEDGPHYGPMSLYDAIVESAAHKLVTQAMTDDGLKEGYSRLVDRVKAIRDEQIKEAVEPLIRKALTKPLRKTNSYGEPTGPETTLSDLLGAEIKEQLASPDRNNFSSNRETVLQKVIKEEVNRALHKELTEALAAGKAEVIKAVRQSGTKVIEDALRDALPL